MPRAAWLSQCTRVEPRSFSPRSLSNLATRDFKKIGKSDAVHENRIRFCNLMRFTSGPHQIVLPAFPLIFYVDFWIRFY